MNILFAGKLNKYTGKPLKVTLKPTEDQRNPHLMIFKDANARIVGIQLRKHQILSWDASAQVVFNLLKP